VVDAVPGAGAGSTAEDATRSSRYSWGELLGTLVQHRDLTGAQAGWAMGEILSGAATPAQIAGLAVALRSKGETVEEVTGLLDAMFEVVTPISIPGRALDVVGSGGDRSMSVNISTMAAIVAAGAGARVVKHGNRSASSKAGSADVLEALGIRLDLPPDTVARLADEVGIGVGTFFNFLGPLANPVRPASQAVGCADPRMAPIMAGVLARRGVDAWVFRGDDGLDELTTTTTSQVWLVHDGAVTPSAVDPEVVGIARARPEDLRGGDVTHNADVVRRVLDGETGPVRDAVLLNAAAALAVYDHPEQSVEDALPPAYARAGDAIDSGAAAALLARWVAASAR
jgi:anthranilate phosphoribosyltransferase